MEQRNSQLENTVQHVYDFINARIRLLKLQGTEKASQLYASFMSVLVLYSLGLIVLLFLSTAGAILIGQQLDNMFYGFGLIALFYLLIFIIIWIFRKKLIIKPMMDYSIREILNDADE